MCRATAMSDSEINQLSHREANSSPDPSGQPPSRGWQGAIARFFKFQEYRTTIRTEVLAGITTFMTMAYILVVNPGILSDAIFLQKSGDFPAESIPSFLTILMMPLMYSIAEGLAIGFITYPLIKTFQGKTHETSVAVWVLAGIFVLRFVMMALKFGG